MKRPQFSDRHFSDRQFRDRPFSENARVEARVATYRGSAPDAPEAILLVVTASFLLGLLPILNASVLEDWRGDGPYALGEAGLWPSWIADR